MREWVAAALCGLMLSACASTVSGTAARESSPVAADDLTAMLLSVEDIEQITGSGDLEIRDTYDEPWASFEVSQELI